MEQFKEFLKGLGYTDEQITAVVDGMKEKKMYLSEEENIDTRYIKLKEQKADTDEQLKTANKTIEELKKANKDNEGLQTKVTEYETTIETLKQESSNKIKQLSIASAIKGALTGVDEKYHSLLEKAFDTSKIIVNDDGTMTGFKEQESLIKTQYADLYTPVITGNNPSNTGSSTQPGKSTSTSNDFISVIQAEQSKRK